MSETQSYQNPLDPDPVLDRIRAANIFDAAKMFRHCLEVAYLQGQKDLAEDISAAVKEGIKCRINSQKVNLEK